jgi:hypothetical protein
MATESLLHQPEMRFAPATGDRPVRHPHIPILGARQAGKSTLSCLMLRDLEQQLKDRHGSLDFEDKRDRARLGLDQGCGSVSKTTSKAGLRPALRTSMSSSLGQHAFLSYMCGCRKPVPPGRMLRVVGASATRPAHARPVLACQGVG